MSFRVHASAVAWRNNRRSAAAVTTTSPGSRLAYAFTSFVGVGHGEALVQSRHVEDLVGHVGPHLRHPTSGYFEVAGPEAVPVAELCQSIVEIGIPPIGHVITPVVRVVNRQGPPSRAARRDGHAPVDTHTARAQFDWSPLGIHAAQAVHEAVA